MGEDSFSFLCCKGNWQQVDTPTVREPGLFKVLTRERAYSLLNPYREQLRARPLYITVDKVWRGKLKRKVLSLFFDFKKQDCLNRSECLQNWNSGELTGFFPIFLSLFVESIISKYLSFSTRDMYFN